MISGFNTDVKLDSASYHVQSEARQSEMLFQTQVFENGRILGKRTRSYANLALVEGGGEAVIQEKLKELHRQVVQAAREGRVQEFLAADKTIQDVDGEGLCLHWLNPEVAQLEIPEQLLLRLSVTDVDRPVEGAMLACRLEISEAAPIHAQAHSGRDGIAELRLTLNSMSFANTEKFVIVRADFGSRSATRKFRLRRG